MTRSAGDIGAGLAQIRPARQIRAGERIHFLGVAGAGASAAALLAHAAGAEVSGCDPGGPSPYTPALVNVGIEIAVTHDPLHVTGGTPPDRLAVSKALTAVNPDHPELRAALAAGIPVEPWHQVVADAAVGRRLVGVAGTHGKSTTSGWLVHVLANAGRDPSAFVGALLPDEVTGAGPATARIGAGQMFVVEADEYAGNFDAFVPDVAVLTSVEWDHPDVFADRSAVEAVFAAWIRRMPPGATLVANIGDAGVDALLGSTASELSLNLIAYAVTESAPDRGGFVRGSADQYATALGSATVLLGRIMSAEPSGTRVEISGLDPLAGPVTVQLASAGRHNVANALGVAGAAMALGLTADEIVTGIQTFAGIGRRLERKGEVAGVVVYDDYGHHPTAIRATIAAVRQREPGRRLWAVYEPLTFHRTAALLDGFASALSSADSVAVADIWPGRDPDTTLTSPTHLIDAVRRASPGIPAVASGSVEATAAWLSSAVEAGDVVLVMGGGHSYLIGDLLLSQLGEREVRSG